MNNKPISIIIKEVKESIIQDLNESQLPVGVIEMIMKELYLEIQMLAEQQLQEDLLQYNNQEQEDLENGDC